MANMQLAGGSGRRDMLENMLSGQSTGIAHTSCGEWNGSAEQK